MKIVWTQLALQDLHQVRNYIAVDSPQAADETMKRIGEAVETLILHPNLGRLGRVRGTRELIVVGTPYLIPYRIKKTRIEILAVIHGSRRWPEDFL